jgi:hypothetical protein
LVVVDDDDDTEMKERRKKYRDKAVTPEEKMQGEKQKKGLQVLDDLIYSDFPFEKERKEESIYMRTTTPAEQRIIDEFSKTHQKEEKEFPVIGNDTESQIIVVDKTRKIEKLLPYWIYWATNGKRLVMEDDEKNPPPPYGVPVDIWGSLRSRWAFLKKTDLKNYHREIMEASHKHRPVNVKKLILDKNKTIGEVLSNGDSITLVTVPSRTGQKLFVCKICDKRFTESSYLTKHHQRIHRRKKVKPRDRALRGAHCPRP